MAAQEAAQSQQTQGVPESRILQARQANASWLTDPTVFAVNRKPAHSNHRYFLGEATEPKQNLDGVWKVNVTQAASIDVENAPFAAADFNDAGFGAIKRARTPADGRLFEEQICECAVSMGWP